MTVVYQKYDVSHFQTWKMEGLSTDVGDFWVGATIKVLENPTALEFLRDCVAPYQPAIIRGAISDWPAIKTWNLATVCEKLNEKLEETCQIKVNVTPDGHGDCLKSLQGHDSTDDSLRTEDGKIFVYPAECMMPTNDFYEMMTNPHDGDAAPYLSLQNDNLRLDMPDLMSDIAASLSIAEEAFGQQHPEAGSACGILNYVYSRIMMCFMKHVCLFTTTHE